MNLFLAPHNDDEALFGCYTIMREKPLVIVVTDGTSHEKFGVSAENRRQESVRGMELLGVKCEFWGLKERDIDPQEFKRLLDKAVNLYRPNIVYAPKNEGGHLDHDFIADHVKNATRYCTYTKDRLYPQGKTEVIPTPAEELIKAMVLDCYVSQKRINPQHFEAVRGRNEYVE